MDFQLKRPPQPANWGYPPLGINQNQLQKTQNEHRVTMGTAKKGPPPQLEGPPLKINQKRSILSINR